MNDVLNIARQTIDIEINALIALRNALDEDFENAVNTIFHSQGRVVVTGIGKSAIVAQKIVATLNSTGTPALFMHAADAIHGDLGMILPADVLICLSKSGETPEIKALVPLLKNFGNKLISIVGNKNSYLAKQADFILHTPIEKEADPNNLAPTTSTTAQMAMGDAIATSLIAMKGFSPNDFAQFHPGGSLGKQLYLRVKDVYTHNPCPKVLVTANLKEIIVEMTTKRLGATAVVNNQNNIEGIITDGDLRRMLEKTTHFENIQAQDIMSSHPKTIDEEEMGVYALEMMRSISITQLIVAKNGKYQGMIHLHDLLKEGLL